MHNDYGEEVVWETEIPPAGSRGRAPVECLGDEALEAETLLLNEHVIFNAPLLKIVKFVAHI